MSIALEVKKSEENESARGDKRRSFSAPTVCKLNSIFRRRNKSTRDFVARVSRLRRSTRDFVPRFPCLVSHFAVDLWQV